MREVRYLAGNPALVVGIAAVLAVLALGVFGALITPYDPNAAAPVLIRDLPDGNYTMQIPPTLPDDVHWLGTDALGRDQLARILTGAKLTLSVVLAAALLRLAIGVTLGLVTGWYGGAGARALRVFASGVTAVPQLLLAILLVLASRPFGPIGFIAALAVVGWPEISEFVASAASRVRTQPFIEAARSIGAPGRRLITRHVMTALAPQLLSLAALETGAVLILLAELGLVGLFLAGGSSRTGDPGQYVGTLKDRAPEWGQMLGSIQFFAMTDSLGTLIPALFVVLAASAFALLADGLRAASDPFGVHRILPGTFNVMAKVLAGALCFTAVGFVTVNVPTTPLTMDEGREVAAKAAHSAWPSSVFVAGVARYTSGSHQLAQPERLTYYFRRGQREVLRITFQDANRLAIEFKPYESEDELDFAPLRALPAGLISYDGPLAKAESVGGGDYRGRIGRYMARVILTWPSDERAPRYDVSYGAAGPNGAIVRGGMNLANVCCIDALTGTPDADLRLRIIGSSPTPGG